MSKRRTASRRNRALKPRGVGRFFSKSRGLVLVVGGITLALAALVLLDNPFATPTAIDANGELVEIGPVYTPGAAPRPGRPAQNFVLADYEGKAVRLNDFEGKVVFLNFWATWCTACEAEMPDMQQLATRYGDDLVVIAVNRGESPDRAKKWSDARQLENLVFVVDPRESVADAYKLPNGMPQSFFIDEFGSITQVVRGAQNFATMENNFLEALGKPAN